MPVHDGIRQLLEQCVAHINRGHQNSTASQPIWSGSDEAALNAKLGGTILKGHDGTSNIFLF